MYSTEERSRHCGLGILSGVLRGDQEQKLETPVAPTRHFARGLAALVRAISTEKAE